MKPEQRRSAFGKVGDFRDMIGTPVSQIPVVQDISSMLQNIKARQAQTSANLRAIDARTLR